MLTDDGTRMDGGDGGNIRCHHHHHLLLVQQQQERRRRRPSPRGAARRQQRSVAGEVVEGHIVRATGRKDRHSKVCTSKGPRDRRVRLSAHTAIQFYDVQDRLGYDRPSKAVDWLIQHAKPAIDQLAHLPHLCPAHHQLEPEPEPEPTIHHHQREDNNPPITHHHEIVPPSLQSDAIADTINLFFPVVSASSPTSLSTHRSNTNNSSSGISYPQQDLRLSLESFRNPSSSTIERPVFSDGWVEQNPSHVLHWGSPAGAAGGGSGYGFPVAEQVVGEGPLMTQRCPLQSNGGGGGSSNSQFMYPFDPDGFAGFHVPASIQGEDDHPPPPLHPLVAAVRGKRKEG